MRLLILHDSPHFGGHEIMLLKLFPALLESEAISEISFCFSEANTKLQYQLQNIDTPKLQLNPWRYKKRRGEPYLAPLRLSYKRSVREILRDAVPDLTLLIQGRIENLLAPMLALPTDHRIVSYIPMAQRLVEMGRGGILGDRIRRRYYARPNRFIVPSLSVSDQLARAGAKCGAVVVDNVVDLPTKVSRGEARAKCGLANDHRKIALFLGRMDVAQKGLDLLVNSIARYAGSLDRWRFVFVGDGPGAEVLQHLKTTGGASIELIKWTDRPQDFLAAADVLLMPSRWEGVPLVMLEAMRYQIPVLGSTIDVFREYLPSANCVDFQEIDLAQALDAIDDARARKQFAEVSGARLAVMSLAHSRQRFVEALTKW